MPHNEIPALANALKAADWSGASIGNKALVEAAASGLVTLAEKLESRRVLLDKLRSHLIEHNVLADFGPELFHIINNGK